MKNSKILNPELIREIAAIGHTEYFVIGDAGLPIPKGMKTVDLSLVAGVPRFDTVLEAVAGELVIESYILADEIKEANPQMLGRTREILKGLPERFVSHEELKALGEEAKVYVRTGETSAYANVILIAGVNF